MSMKELFSVTLNARQIREACEAFVGRRIDAVTEDATAEVPADLQIIVTVRKKRAPRKPRGNGHAVASANGLSAAEEHFG